MLKASNGLKRITSDILSIYIALIPWLFMYYSGIPGTNLADIVLGVFLLFIGIFLLISKDNNVVTIGNTLDCYWPILGFAIYVLLHMIITWFINRDVQSNDIIVRSTRILFYLISSVVLLPSTINPRLFFKAAKLMAVLASLYLIFQVIIYAVSGEAKSGFLPFMRVYSPQYTFAYKTGYLIPKHRPASFFLEPAHFARYISMVLPLFLMKSSDIGWKNKLSIFMAAFLTISVLLSTSSIGMALSSISWAIFAFERLKAYYLKKNYKYFAFISLLIGIIIISIIILMPSVRYTISRSLNFSADSAFNARLGSVKLIINKYTNILRLFFGNGYGHIPAESVFIPDFFYILHGTGFIGLIFILILYTKFLFKRYISLFYNVIIFVTFVMLFVDDSFNSTNIVFILSLHFCTLRIGILKKSISIY